MCINVVYDKLFAVLHSFRSIDKSVRDGLPKIKTTDGNRNC